jgi:hypothetical protein
MRAVRPTGPSNARGYRLIGAAAVCFRADHVADACVADGLCSHR